jgi:Phophatidylserine decarboxylase/Phosphatidylserine decarboxylase
VVLPLGAILDWTMGTPAGFAAFRDRRINAMLKKILGVWCEFLSSGDSRYVLNDSPSGWKGEAARRAIGIEQFQHDPEDEYWGFTSWNDFFTRRLEGADAAEPRNSQSCLAHVATRAVILIEADNPVIGLTAFVPVGMNEVSSCVIDQKIQPGYHVNKGEELGYFQFGGSTHCLVFRPGAIAGFSLTAIPQPHDPHPPLLRVCSKLATAVAG